jgi:hypothetical protein
MFTRPLNRVAECSAVDAGRASSKCARQVGAANRLEARCDRRCPGATAVGRVPYDGSCADPAARSSSRIVGAVASLTAG